MTMTGKQAFITGGANGIGKGIATAFAVAGCSVIIADIHQEDGEKTVREIGESGGRAAFVRLDISDERMIIRALTGLSRLDILVNNAGVFPSGSLEDLSLEDWNLTFEIGLKSAFLCCKYALPLLKQSGKGNIINIASINAFCMSPGLPAYAAAKGGMVALTRQIAVEYAPQGVRANSISPGYILTKSSSSILEDPLELQMTLECYPVGRIGTPEDVAHAAMFLAADQAGFINGIDVVVDGGMSLQSVGSLIKPGLRSRWKPGTMKLELDDHA